MQGLVDEEMDGVGIREKERIGCVVMLGFTSPLCSGRGGGGTKRDRLYKASGGRLKSAEKEVRKEMGH